MMYNKSKNRYRMDIGILTTTKNNINTNQNKIK